nr:hypothetical protein [Lentzea albidocapillata]
MIVLAFRDGGQDVLLRQFGQVQGQPQRVAIVGRLPLLVHDERERLRVVALIRMAPPHDDLDQGGVFQAGTPSLSIA